MRRKVYFAIEMQEPSIFDCFCISVAILQEWKI
jgi:hypothetical protein